MTDSIDFAVKWTKVGIVAGLSACIVYPLLIAAPLPRIVTVLLAAVFGPLLTVACVGLYHFMSVRRNTVTLQIATISTVGGQS